jgi:hypothetical protein
MAQQEQQRQWPRAVRALIVAALVLVPAPASGWGNSGHMATGGAAYDNLRRTDSAAIKTVVAIMQSHPDSARFLRNLAGLTGAARDRRLFELMARWPDDIRDSTAYDHPDWHYALRVVAPIGTVLGFRVGKAIDQFDAMLAMARNAGAPTGDRAIALCWVMHLAGDMHEPLHAGHWWSLRFPKSDRAGTIAWVRPGPDQPPVKLHEFWDNAPNRLAEGAFANEAANSTEIAARIEAAFPSTRLTPTTPDAVSGASAHEQFLAWVGESTRLAKDVAYTGPALDASDVKTTAPLMSEPYAKQVRGIADERLAEASWRIALLLRTLPRR